jgi:RNA polymerase sigma factor (TIGR02999 family)
MEQAPCPPTDSGTGPFLALRRPMTKTVMAVQDSQPASAYRGLGPQKTPEQRRALDLLFSLTYEELRRLASTVKRSDPGITLSPTALVNEAWMKLAKTPYVSAMSRLHFKRIAARAMRQLLVEAARRRHARKRGGPDAAFVVFDDSMEGRVSSEKGLLELNIALDELARVAPRQAMIVESRFFGGAEMGEIAGQLGVSEATIFREWRAAKAWLGNELRRSQ